MVEAISILLIGLVLLLAGSNLLVTSTEKIKNYLSISGFFASFFMMGVATSAPEIFISIQSALKNNTILAIGNGIGSNISNIALVFCISVLFMKRDLNSLSIPIRPFLSMIILTASLFFLILFDSYFDMYDSLTLIIILLISFYYFISPDDEEIKSIENKKSVLLTMSLSVIALFMLIYGSDLFINGATNIAVIFGVSSYVIGLTLTAIGTSLPELAANIQSARKGHNDFIIGNIIGSNIFNIAVAISLAGIISSSSVNIDDFIRDILILSLFMLIFYFMLKSNNNIIKTVYSMTLVITYILYIVFLLK
tara:strand:+ start:5152 stop:6078 length:927 start_codon:yes stop_codon:yes gene_type:complete